MKPRDEIPDVDITGTRASGYASGRDEMTRSELWRAGVSYDEIERLTSECHLCGERIYPAAIRWDEGRAFHDGPCPEES